MITHHQAQLKEIKMGGNFTPALQYIDLNTYNFQYIHNVADIVSLKSVIWNLKNFKNIT
jgi:hypothetical protein